MNKYLDETAKSIINAGAVYISDDNIAHICRKTLNIFEDYRDKIYEINELLESVKDKEPQYYELVFELRSILKGEE